VKALELRQGSDVASALEGIPRGLRWGTLIDGLRAKITGNGMQRVRLEIGSRRLPLGDAPRAASVAAFVTYATDALGHTPGARTRSTTRIDRRMRSSASSARGFLRRRIVVLSEPRIPMLASAAAELRATHGCALRLPGVEVGAHGKEAGRARRRSRAETHERSCRASDRRAALSMGGDSGGTRALRPRRAHRRSAARVRDTVAGRPLSDFVRSQPRCAVVEHDRDGIWLRLRSLDCADERADGSLLDVRATLLAAAGDSCRADMPGTCASGSSAPRVPTYANLVPPRSEALPSVNENALRAARLRRVATSWKRARDGVEHARRFGTQSLHLPGVCSTMPTFVLMVFVTFGPR
jgi:hypothetical protein